MLRMFSVNFLFVCCYLHIYCSSHQLETYFRNLGQRKNLSRRDWIAVFRALDSQKAFGRRFRLFLSGKEVEERELQKKRKNAKPAQPLVESLVDAGTWIMFRVTLPRINSACNRSTAHQPSRRSHCQTATAFGLIKKPTTQYHPAIYVACAFRCQPGFGS